MAIANIYTVEGEYVGWFDDDDLPTFNIDISNPCAERRIQRTKHGAWVLDIWDAHGLQQKYHPLTDEEALALLIEGRVDQDSDFERLHETIRQEVLLGVKEAEL